MSSAPELGPPFSLVALDAVDSTNDEAKRLAQQGRGHGTTVWALEQSAGRGRRGRAWISPRGNLHVSFLLDTGRPLAQAAQLGFAAAVALCEALAPLAPALRFQCKWPNDVWCDGRKIAGMLLEPAGRGDLMVLGIGVDVVAAPDPALFPAICLKDAGADTDAAQVLEALCRRLAPWLDVWAGEGFAPVRTAWLGWARGLGDPIEARLERESLHGTFAGLDEDGALLLELPDGARRRILAGDVFFPDA